MQHKRVILPVPFPAVNQVTEYRGTVSIVLGTMVISLVYKFGNGNGVPRFGLSWKTCACVLIFKFLLSRLFCNTLYTDNPSFHSFLNLFLYLQFINSVFPFFFSFPNSLALSFSISPPPLALRNWIHVQRGAGFGTFVDSGVKGHLSGWYEKRAFFSLPKHPLS
jgi:hypothetical protein